MKEFNEKVYRLLTYGLNDILKFFIPGFILLILYTIFAIFSMSLRRVFISLFLWAGLLLLIFYLHKNKIVHVAPPPRERPEPVYGATDEPVYEAEQGEADEYEIEYPTYIMDVNEAEFSHFTFNDYVVDTFKKQDSNKILDLLADKNKLILEDLKK